MLGNFRRLLHLTGRGRCTFGRILWNSKVRSFLEYGSEVWSSAVSSTHIGKIDRLQGSYFKSVLGVPKFASTISTLTDVGVLRQSRRFYCFRLKLAVRLKKGAVPDCVSRVFKRYSSINNLVAAPKRTKHFTDVSINNAVKLRDAWIRNNPNLVPKDGLSLEEVRKKFSTPGPGYGFRYVYPVSRSAGRGAQIRAWSAQISIFKVSCDFPDVDNEHTDNITDSLDKLLSQSIEDVGNKGELFSRILRTQIRKWSETCQYNSFSSQPGRSETRSFRRAWLHDLLIHSLDASGARVLRKLRLGVSRLRGHTFFMNENSRNCMACSAQVPETVDHFFLDCTAYGEQRARLFNASRRILKSLGCEPSGAAFLGFIPGLRTPCCERRTRVSRRSIMSNSCRFIVDSGRFTEDLG